MKVNPEWWKTLFDEVYLITDARSVCDEALTSREVDMLEELLRLDKSLPVVDLCGGHARHAIELCRRGFTDVTVVDYSEYLIELGRNRARSDGVELTFVQADARDTGLPRYRYAAAIVMANSFGYFCDMEDDRKFLMEAHQLLSPGGTILLDLVDRDYILENFKPVSWHEADEDVVVCRNRSLVDDVAVSREMVLSKKDGLIRDETYCVRLYSEQRISELLQSTGFSTPSIHNSFSCHRRPGDYGFLNNRMIVTAKRG